jgi:hypothetical protein
VLTIVGMVVSLLAGWLLVGSPDPAAAEGRRPLKVVLIGDSYAAGNGARNAAGDRSFAFSGPPSREVLIELSWSLLQLLAE